MDQGSRPGKGQAHSNAVVSQVVRIYMALRRETHDDVADALGITRPAVSARMNGRTSWSLQDLDRLAEHYDVPADTFLRPQPGLLEQLRGGPLLDPIGRRRRRPRSGDHQDDDASDSRAARAGSTLGVAAPARAAV